MKISVDIDCTPVEARSFMGLPDVTPINDKYIESLMSAMENAGSVEQMQTLIRSFSPMGEAGMNLFKQLMDIGAGAMGGAARK